MGLFKGLMEIVVAPLTVTTKIVKKTTEEFFEKDWEVQDALTFGVTKVLKSTKDSIVETGEKVDNSFKEDKDKK